MIVLQTEFCRIELNLILESWIRIYSKSQIQNIYIYIYIYIWKSKILIGYRLLKISFIEC